MFSGCLYIFSMDHFWEKLIFFDPFYSSSENSHGGRLWLWERGYPDQHPAPGDPPAGSHGQGQEGPRLLRRRPRDHEPGEGRLHHRPRVRRVRQARHRESQEQVGGGGSRQTWAATSIESPGKKVTRFVCGCTDVIRIRTKENTWARGGLVKLWGIKMTVACPCGCGCLHTCVELPTYRTFM